MINEPVGAGWVFSPGTFSSDHSGIVGYSSTTSNDFQPIAPPPDGDQFAFTESDSSITQTVGGFTIGQAYRLDFAQGYGGSSASGGSAISVILEPAGGGESQTIAPLEIANSPSLVSRSSDVFIATSESYDLLIQNSDVVPVGYRDRHALVDQFSFVPVSDPATTRTTYSATLSLTAASNLELAVLLAGNVIDTGITSPVVGQVGIDFDIINGNQVASLHFDPSQLDLDPLLTGFVDLVPFGSADATLTDGFVSLFNETSPEYGDHSTSVNADGEFLLGSTFLEFGGNAELELDGPIVDILGFESLIYDLEELAAADLGITYIGNDTIFADPGRFGFVPTGNPNEYSITLDIPVLAVTTLNGDVGLEIQLSGFLQAQGIVVVPEPSSFVLALLSTGVAIVFHRRQRRRA